MSPTDQALFEAAERVRPRAHVPYSHFHVGAAILADDGNIYAGCNIENAAYPLGNCAEASAIAAMVAGGGKRITRHQRIPVGMAGHGANPDIGQSAICQQAACRVGTLTGQFPVGFSRAGVGRRVGMSGDGNGFRQFLQKWCDFLDQGTGSIVWNRRTGCEHW